MSCLNDNRVKGVFVQVLVTGSSGFIGRHTVNGLKAKNYAVKTFDLTANKDVRNQDAVNRAVRGADVVMHFGANAVVPYSFEYPAEVAEINITGTINLLEACRKHDVKKFVFASSSSVYGEPEELPVKENHPLKPVTPYGLTKLAGEQYADLYSELYGLKTVCLRYFNVYGIGQSRGLVADSLKGIKNKKPMVIFGDGRQTRDFVNVADAVQANLLALHVNTSGVFNVGVGVETSVRDVVRILQELTGTNSIQYKPKRVGEIRRIYADIRNAKRVLKYRPKVSLRDGLRETVEAG